MKRSILILVMALSALPMLAAAQLADACSAPEGLHPQTRSSQHEILGDGQLPHQPQNTFASGLVTDHLAPDA